MVNLGLVLAAVMCITEGGNYHREGTMFAVVKYLAIDYLYEKLTRERESFDSLAIHIPSCLYQNKNYYHNGCFVDDKYRRPWKRVSVDCTEIVMNFPVLDLWKESLYVEDFLEKKPISSTYFCIHNEVAEVVPSSNPCSQSDIEETCMLMKNDDKEELALTSFCLSKYAPAILKEQGEESLYIEDELIFSDSLTQYTACLPAVHTLLSRLSIFYVQDPLLNSEGNNIREEDIFRECFTFKESITTQIKEEGQHEVFCKQTLRDEQVTMLPLLLQVCPTSALRLDTEIPKCLTLKSLLEVSSEVLEDENKSFKITTKDFPVKIIPEIIETSNHGSTDIFTTLNRSTPEFNSPENYIPFSPRELEMPLTPPDRSDKLFVNSLLMQLQPEPASPCRKSNLITESSAECFEGLMWQSEKYQHPMNLLLLAVTELKTLLSVQDDITVLSSFKEDEWIDLRENLILPRALETLDTDLDYEERAVCTNVEEAFGKITYFQAEEWLKEKNSFVSIPEESFSISDDSGMKKFCCSPLEKETFPPTFALGPPTAENSPCLAGNRATPEKHIKKTYLEGDSGKPMQEEKASVETNLSSNREPAPFELLRKSGDDLDLLSSFIMLRSQRMVTQNEESKELEIQEEVPNAQEETPPSGDHDSPDVLNATVLHEKQTNKNESIGSIIIKAAESQFQAYLILEATVAPVLKALMTFGICDWSFATLNFDDSRFFLKQQEKVVSDLFKQGLNGTKDTNEVTLFKHAAILHLLVTVRDLLLTCSLSTALGYFSKAKDKYMDFLGCTLDNIWRQLKIVHIATQNHEDNPKISELEHQVSKWVNNNMNNQNKVVIITRMDFDEEIAVLINKIQGLKTGYLKAEKKGTFLDSKNVISGLENFGCVVVHNQYIGPDFPWSYFSLVVEYNYSENSCWVDLCKNMKIQYIAFKTALPETGEIPPDNFRDVLLRVQIPYIFLTSEGLLNIPEILQLLESKYNITFIERRACESLQFFGSTECYVVITIDECTAIIIQNVEELNQEKSSDNIVLRLLVLSLQYTSCWIIFYSRERLNSEYSLAAKTLHHLALIYAALVPFTQKSEDFGIKVALTPGFEETALLVRQIADYTLMTSKRHPQEWLDKSWLSVLPSEEETCLLTFPWVNPLVAQVMLRKSSSLEWLLSSTLDQLQKLLPEVPEKVLKHFNDTTSSYTLKTPFESASINEMVPVQDHMSSAITSCSQAPFPETLFSGFREPGPFTEYSRCFHKLQNSKSCPPSYCQNESCTARHKIRAPSPSYEGNIHCFQDNKQVDRQHQLTFPPKMEMGRRVHSPLTQNNINRSVSSSHEAAVPQLEYSQNGSLASLETCSRNRTLLSKALAGQNLEMPVSFKNTVHQDVNDVHGMKRQCNSALDFKYPWHLVSNKNELFQQSSSSFLGAFGGKASSRPAFQLAETFREGHLFTEAMNSSSHDPNFCKAASNPDIFFNLGFQKAGDYTGKKGLNSLSTSQREQDTSAGLEFIQLPQLKKRRLTFEKDPRRSDGQTRLKFF